MSMLLSSISFAEGKTPCQRYRDQGNPFTLEEWKQNESECTNWMQERGVSCVFNSRRAESFKRLCKHVCATENFCAPVTPYKIEGPCTKYFKIDGVVCVDETGRDRDLWKRECTDQRLSDLACMDKNPNHL